MEKKIKCPWCGEEFSYKKIVRHMSTTCKCIPSGMTKKDIIDATIVCLYGNVVDDIINDYNNNFSLPDLKKKIWNIL